MEFFEFPSVLYFMFAVGAENLVICVADNVILAWGRLLDGILKWSGVLWSIRNLVCA